MEASTTPPEGTAPEEAPAETPVDPAARPEHPDEGAGPLVDPVQGDQGPQVAEQTPADALAPQSPEGVRVSAPPAEAQSGVPALPENEGVEAQPQYAGPVAASEPEAAESEEQPAP